MKKIFAFATAFIIVLTLKGQNVQIATTERWFGGNWQNYSKQLYTYDGSNNTTSTSTEYWDGPSSTWKKQNKTDYLFNANGKAQQDLTQSFDNPSGLYVNSIRTTYYYNTSSKVEKITSERWVSGNWQNYLNQSYSYNGNNVASILTASWDNSSSFWKENSKLDYTYDADGKVQQFVAQSWVVASGSWINSSRAVFEYYATNTLKTLTSETWSDGKWLSQMKQSYTYNVNNKAIVYSAELWDVASSSWKNQGKTDYTFNADGSAQYNISQSWDNTSSTFNNTIKVSYTYLNTNVMVETGDNKFVLYPNPSSYYTTINCNGSATVVVFNQNGNQILEALSFYNTINISVENFKNGVYFFKIVNEGTAETVKFIKE